MGRFIKLLGLLFMLGSCHLSAQEVTYQDVIYLKDGSILKGSINEYKKGEEVIITLLSGQQLSIQDAEIERIVQEDINKKDRKNPIQSGKFYHAFLFSGNFGNNLFSDGDWGIGLEHISGYWLNDNWGIGIGGGLIQYSADYSWRVIPVFVDFKLKTAERSPFYLGGDIGIGYPMKNENRNVRGGEAGERFRIGVGKIWTTRSDARLSLDVAYLHQRAVFRSRAFGWVEDDIIERNIRFKRYQIRMGVLF